MGRKPTIRKTKAPPDLPKLCLAVRKLRATAGWSQEAMGRHTGLALQTIYRFEAGKQIPRDYGVLSRLRDCAITLGLTEEATLFDYTLQGWQTMLPPNPPYIPSPVVRESRSVEQARLSMAAELAVALFPDASSAAEEALAVPLRLVDQAFKDSHRWNTVYDAEYYRTVKARLDELVKQKLFHTRRKKGDGK
jgi:transcriptional regulator with XRE-family HTH domain